MVHFRVGHADEAGAEAGIGGIDVAGLADEETVLSARGSSITGRDSGVIFTVGSSPPSKFQPRGSSPLMIHLPSLVMPTGIGSNRSVSAAPSTPAVEMQEIECSSARPPLRAPQHASWP